MNSELIALIYSLHDYLKKGDYASAKSLLIDKKRQIQKNMYIFNYKNCLQ